MVKRGIGAVVLAIIAALLLGYLLKDKSRERQEVVDMKLPGTAEMKIPSLTDVKDSMSQAVTNITSKTSNADEKSSNVTQTTTQQPVIVDQKPTQNTSSNTTPSTANSSTKPGFAIRPPGANEQRDIVDLNNEKAGSLSNQKTTSAVTTTDKTPQQNLNKVVASSSEKITQPVEKFKPRLVEEKKQIKPVIVSSPKKTTPAKTSKPVVTSAIATSGKYSIQLLATSSQSRAKKLARTMQSEGYQSFITQTQRNNKILYRVRIGAHKDRNSALKAQQNLKRRYQKNFFVQNSLVVTN